jgi:hypothetical protein
MGNNYNGVGTGQEWLLGLGEDMRRRVRDVISYTARKRNGIDVRMCQSEALRRTYP